VIKSYTIEVIIIIKLFMDLAQFIF